MKKKIYGIVKVVLFLVILGVCFMKVENLLQRKTSIIRYGTFFEQEADYDVLFMGSSHVVNGIFPMELWEDYGIVSYNLGGYGNQLGAMYWVMQNALDYTTPKLMVIDVYGVHFQQNDPPGHDSIDVFPMSKTKYNMVLDMFDEGSEEYASRWEYFFDFSVYHSRWNDLKEEDFNYELNKSKGAIPLVNVAVPAEYQRVSPTEVSEISGPGMEYLCKMIEDCQARGIEVLLTHVPYPAEVGYQIVGNSMHELAERYGVNYIDFVQMNQVVEYATDCYDSASHLNPSGARKVSEYLGEYIMSNYDIQDRRTDEVYAHWHEEYKEYQESTYETLEQQTKLENYLMLLRDENLSACVYIAAESGYLQNPVIHRLLDNMALNGTVSNLSQAVLEGKDYLLQVDNKKETVVDAAISGIEEADMLKEYVGEKKTLVKVVVYDKESGEVVSTYIEDAE